MKTIKMFLILQLFISLGCASLAAQPGTEISQQSVKQNVIPQSNAEIRFWYNQQVVIIPVLNREWINEGVEAKERALRAYTIRHTARIHARLLMRDKEEVDLLRQRDMEKYGNPDGPTFEYLVEKNRDKGLSDEEIWQSIIESSGRTSEEFNKKFGIVQS